MGFLPLRCRSFSFFLPSGLALEASSWAGTPLELEDVFCFLLAHASCHFCSCFKIFQWCSKVNYFSSSFLNTSQVCSTYTSAICVRNCIEPKYIFSQLKDPKQIYTLSCSVVPLWALLWTWPYHPQNLLTISRIIPQRWARELQLRSLSNYLCKW